MSLFLATCGTIGKTISGGGGATVTDDDAQAFVDAASISDQGIADAIDALVIDLKAASLWTKLEVIYPWAGGSAAAHKFNLKDPQDTDGAFRGTINGTITHNANGVTGDASTGFINTHYVQSTDGAEDNEHFSVYSRTDESSTTRVGGVLNNANAGGTFITPRNGTNFTTKSQGITQTSSTVSTSLGYFSVNRTASGSYRKRQNATSVTVSIDGSSDQAPLAHPFYILAVRTSISTAVSHTSKNLAWAALGQGLTESEDEDLKDIVQAYQVAMGRNV